MVVVVYDYMFRCLDYGEPKRGNGSKDIDLKNFYNISEEETSVDAT